MVREGKYFKIFLQTNECLPLKAFRILTSQGYAGFFCSQWKVRVDATFSEAFGFQ